MAVVIKDERVKIYRSFSSFRTSLAQIRNNNTYIITLRTNLNNSSFASGLSTG